jgi:hypothetical protein
LAQFCLCRKGFEKEPRLNAPVICPRGTAR